MTRSCIRSLPAIGLIAAMCVAAPLPVLAQDGDAVCEGLESQAAEIACLRALLGESQPAPDQPASQEHNVPSAAAPQPVSAAPPADRFGVEQVRSETPTAGDTVREERLATMIVDSRRDRRGLLVMQLENGQIWRQDESRGVPLRFDEDSPTQVEISRSGFGGYRMHFPEAGRRIVVSRLR